MRSVHSIKPFWITRAAIRITWQIVDQMDDRFFIVFSTVFLAQICHLLIGNKFSIWIHHFSCQIHNLKFTLFTTHQTARGCCYIRTKNVENNFVRIGTVTQQQLTVICLLTDVGLLLPHSHCTHKHTHTVSFGRGKMVYFCFFSFFLSLRSFSWNSEWIEM